MFLLSQIGITWWFYTMQQNSQMVHQSFPYNEQGLSTLL